MIDQGMGGDIVYIVSARTPLRRTEQRRLRRGKADQAHQVRLLAAELGEHGIRVNGVNPDGVVRGSGIFAKGWGASERRCTASRRKSSGVLRPAHAAQAGGPPEHVAAAVFALTAGDLSLTTGLHVPVDAGVAAAFLR